MSAREDELRDLWDKIVQCEREMPAKNPAEFAAKKRELDTLRRHYQRLSGLSCNPNNWRENEVRGDRQFIREAQGQMDERHETQDSMGQMPEWYRPFTKG